MVYLLMTQDNMTKYWLGKKRSKEDREKFRLSHLGLTYPNRKKPVFLKPNKGWFKKGFSPWNKGKKNCYTKEQLSKILRFLSPNKREVKLLEILNEVYPNEWSFVGNGKLIIEGKNPDYVNINGKKLLIELFGRKWHDVSEIDDRGKLFAKYGYRTLFIWDNEVNSKKKLLKKIDGFVSK